MPTWCEISAAFCSSYFPKNSITLNLFFFLWGSGVCVCLLDPPSLQIWALKWENLPGEEKYRPRLQHVTLAARDSDGCVNIERCVFCLTALIWSQIHMPQEAARRADRPFYHEWYSTEELIDPSHSAHTQMHRLVAVSYLKWSGFWKSYWLRGRGGGGEKRRGRRGREGEEGGIKRKERVSLTSHETRCPCWHDDDMEPF